LPVDPLPDVSLLEPLEPLPEVPDPEDPDDPEEPPLAVPELPEPELPEPPELIEPDDPEEPDEPEEPPELIEPEPDEPDEPEEPLEPEPVSDEPRVEPFPQPAVPKPKARAARSVVSLRCVFFIRDPVIFSVTAQLRPVLASTRGISTCGTVKRSGPLCRVAVPNVDSGMSPKRIPGPRLSRPGKTP
jgi:hypothetical protein